MFFIGKIRPEVAQYLCDKLPALKGRAFVVGCSGAFTFEQIAARYADPSLLVGNDVSLYSGLIGSMLARQPFKLTVTNPDFRWLDPYVADEVAATATVSLLLQNRYCLPQKNAHQRRVYEQFFASFPDLHAKLAAKLHEDVQHTRLDRYNHVDVVDHFHEYADHEAVFCYFAPYYLGGYTSMYKLVERIFDYPHARFQELTPERSEAMFKFLAARDHIAVFNERRPDLHLAFRAPLTRLSHEYLFANVFDRPGHRQRVLRMDEPRGQQITPETIFTATSTFTVAHAPLAEVMFLKQRLVKKVQGVSSGGYGYWFLIDGQIAGFVEITRGQFDKFTAYMLSDMALPSPYKRLSKLILMATRSTEFWRLVERDLMMRVTALYTTAFTDQPVSMKYRGPYELVSRKKDAAGNPFLQYRTEPSEMTLGDTFKDWWTRYGHSVRSDRDSRTAGRAE